MAPDIEAVVQSIRNSVEESDWLGSDERQQAIHVIRFLQDDLTALRTRCLDLIRENKQLRSNHGNVPRVPGQ